MSGPKQARTLVRVVPSWTEPLVSKASPLIGGPLGGHAVIGRARYWTPLRVIVALALLTCALGWLFKAPCLQQFQAGDGKLALDWRGNHQYVSLCYTDIVTLWSDHHLSGGELPYTASWTDDLGSPDQRVRYMDYPVVTGYGLYVLARLTSRYLGLAGSLGVSGPSIVQPSKLPIALPEVVFFDIVALTMVFAWLAVVWAVHRQRRSRPWDAALVAVSPVVAFHIFTGVDAWAVGLTALGMCALARGRPVGAGVLIGLATAAKVYPALILLPVLLVAWRRASSNAEPGGLDGVRRLGDVDGLREWAVAGRVLGAAALSWTAVNLPVALFQTPGWLEFLRYGVYRRVEPDSVWYALSSFTGWPGFDGVLQPGQSPIRLDMVAIGCFALCCGALVVLTARASRPPRLASLSFLVVAAALLVGKAPNPQFSLWLVPLAVLALPHWRLLLIWMAAEAALWIPRMYFYVGEANKGLPEQAYETAVLMRDAVLLVLIVLVVRSVLRPGADPVRRLGADDPDWPGAGHSQGSLTRTGSAASGPDTPGQRE